MDKFKGLESREFEKLRNHSGEGHVRDFVQDASNFYTTLVRGNAEDVDLIFRKFFRENWRFFAETAKPGFVDDLCAELRVLKTLDDHGKRNVATVILDCVAIQRASGLPESSSSMLSGGEEGSGKIESSVIETPSSQEDISLLALEEIRGTDISSISSAIDRFTAKHLDNKSYKKNDSGKIVKQVEKNVINTLKELRSTGRKSFRHKDENPDQQKYAGSGNDIFVLINSLIKLFRGIQISYGLDTIDCAKDLSRFIQKIQGVIS